MPVNYRTGGGDRISALALTDVIFLMGGNGPDNLRGGPGDDTLDGGNGPDQLRGYGGNDWLIGGNGPDRLWGDEGDDTLDGGDGDDLGYGGEGNDNLIGENGNDSLEGGNRDDTLEGGGGNDTLQGGNGRDDLIGGAGADVFRFVEVQDSSVATYDKITDFEGAGDAAGDLIDLRVIDANEIVEGNEEFTFTGTTPGGAGTVWTEGVGAETWLRINTDSDDEAEMTIRIDDGVTQPGDYTAADFLL